MARRDAHPPRSLDRTLDICRQHIRVRRVKKADLGQCLLLADPRFQRLGSYPLAARISITGIFDNNWPTMGIFALDLFQDSAILLSNGASLPHLSGLGMNKTPNFALQFDAQDIRVAND